MSQLFNNIQSKLDLNGPSLSFSTEPVGIATSVAAGIATFIGIATATFPDSQTSRNTNTGTLAYQWYERGSGDPIKLSDGDTGYGKGTVTGTASTTLTVNVLSNSAQPTGDHGRVFYLSADYVPSAYSQPASSVVTAGTARSTANAFNEPLITGNATLSVNPTISIDTQPEDSVVVEDIDTTFTVVATNSNPLFGITEQNRPASLSYQWYLNGANLSDDFESILHAFSGEKTPTLTIKRFDPGLDRVYVAVSHPFANPGIVTSTEAKLDVAAARTFILWEKIGDGTRQEKGQRDLATSGPFTARARANIGARIIQIFSPEKDVDVKVTMGAAAGQSIGGNRGGEGGISVFKMTFKQNTEYTVKLGIHYNQGGGPRGGIGGGGGLAVIYEKAKVLAVCGGGGGATNRNRGGDGGGLNVIGERGRGGAGGAGGSYIIVDQLPINGVTQAGRSGPEDFDNESNPGGRLSGCTIGKYWREQGKLPCEDVGTGVAFLGVSGEVLSDTTSTSTGDIVRGYKTGQGHRNNGGAGSTNAGGGGAGAIGGFGGGFQGGGGGASGYHSSQVELLSSSTLPNGTRLGGNDDVAFISVEVYEVGDDQEPLIPPKSSTTTERTVTFTMSRSAFDQNTVTFTKQSGIGPDSITFGPNGGAITTQITSGAVYVRTSSTNSGPGSLAFRLSGNTLALDDRQGAGSDNDFTDLTITPSDGTFTSTSRYEANW